jgi:hypothetical protein
MELYFSEYFGVDQEVLEGYGAFDISVVSDLPLFIDPFLLFNSEKPEYQALHNSMIDYLVFLRDKATVGLNPALIASWYQFKEVKQNWLGFTLLGNGGHALGKNFATSLHESLGKILADFGEEQVTSGSHLEKLCLIKGGVGRDSISDFTTNLIKDYLLTYTQEFARQHLEAERCREFSVTKARFNYKTETWETRKYYLPAKDNDFVLLTPNDMLTRDDTWISYPDMIKKFSQLPEAISDDQLRAQIDNHFRRQLRKRSTAQERTTAAQNTIREFPQIIDYYIKQKEVNGDRAQAVSADKVEDTRRVLVDQLKIAVRDLEEKSDFYQKPWTSYKEALDRALEFKRYVEDCDGYRVINRAGRPFSQETEVQLFFGLIWCKSEFDANREVNNGRGPVDFKISYGSKDKSLIEFKLASNTSLKRNLENQVKIYEAANDTRTSVKVIICYTAAEQRKVNKILKDLGLLGEPAVVVIDARNDNKPSASTV